MTTTVLIYYRARFSSFQHRFRQSVRLSKDRHLACSDVRPPQGDRHRRQMRGREAPMANTGVTHWAAPFAACLVYSSSEDVPSKAQVRMRRNHEC